MNFTSTFTSIQHWFSSKNGKRLSQFLRLLFIATLVVYLVNELYEIGFDKLIKSLPTTPWFYVIFVILYFTLPITEQFIYRMSLKFDFWSGFKIFTKKKVLNQEVVGYSGEAYFYYWAQKNLSESPKKILQVIKDNTIISSLASTITAIVLLSIFLYSVNANVLSGDLINTQNLLLGGFILIVLIVLIITFRNKLISVDKKTAQKMFVTHELRILWVYFLEIFQWTLVIPSVPIFAWFTFLSVKIIASRIPLVPNVDLLFIAASVEISKYTAVGEAEIAAILLTSTVLTKILNLVFFLAFSIDKDKLPSKPIES